MKSGSTTTSRDERLRRTSAFLMGKIMGGIAAARKTQNASLVSIMTSPTTEIAQAAVRP
jgi:hypothetical protein